MSRSAIDGLRAQAFQSTRIVGSLSPGSTLLLFTDGLIERRTNDLDEGLDRLKVLATEARSFSLDRLCDALLAELLGSRPREDDVALLTIRLQEATVESEQQPTATASNAITPPPL